MIAGTKYPNKTIITKPIWITGTVKAQKESPSAKSAFYSP